MKISRNFILALKMDPRPAYEICNFAKIDPSWLSKAIYGAVKLEGFEERVERIGGILGLSISECWEKEAEGE